METLLISAATVLERDWATQLMADSEPWVTLGRNLDSCRASCFDPNILIFVARTGRIPRGFIILVRRGVAGSPYIVSIAVEENSRGKGVGGRLLDFAENFFRADARNLFLCVSSFNPRARALYERHGYAVVGELKDYIIEGASEILMHKRLRSA